MTTLLLPCLSFTSKQVISHHRGPGVVRSARGVANTLVLEEKEGKKHFNVIGITEGLQHSKFLSAIRYRYDGWHLQESDSAAAAARVSGTNQHIFAPSSFCAECRSPHILHDTLPGK